MKKILFFSLAALWSCALSAQHETLFGRARDIGAFGGPIVEMGLNNDLNTAVGGGGAIVIDNFFIGGYGVGSVDFDALIENDEIDQIELGHGGFWLGYAFPSYKVIHLYGSGRVGWGGVGIDVSDNSNFPQDVDNVFVLTPELGLELNLTRWFRVGATYGYRFVKGVNEDLGYYKADSFDGSMLNLTFRFGWFGWHRHNN